MCVSVVATTRVFITARRGSFGGVVQCVLHSLPEGFRVVSRRERRERLVVALVRLEDAPPAHEGQLVPLRVDTDRLPPPYDPADRLSLAPLLPLEDGELLLHRPLRPLPLERRVRRCGTREEEQGQSREAEKQGNVSGHGHGGWQEE